MTRIDKLLNRFLENPQSLKFKKIRKILQNFGYKRVSVDGSHHKFVNLSTNIKFTIPVHNNDCRKVYKIDVAKLIRNILTNNKDDNEAV